MARKKNWKRIDVSAVHESLVESNIARNISKEGIADAIVIDVAGRLRSSTKLSCL